jgi:hypothetical protein
VPDGGNLLAQADRLQRLDGLRAGVDRGADLAERGRLLENISGNAEGLQRIRRGKPGETAADDRDPHAQSHSFPPASPVRRHHSTEIFTVCTICDQRTCCCAT